MRHARLIALLLAAAAAPIAAQTAPTDEPQTPPPAPVFPLPAALTAEAMPPVPLELAARVRPYLESRGAGFAGWDPNTRAVLISTRFANVSQLHRVAMPMGARTQLSFEAEPVSGGYAPGKGDVIVVSKDRGGDEYYQLHTLKDGRLTLLTDGKSRNQLNSWSQDGQLIGFTSTRRNGVDADIYVMDPRDPASTRMVHERQAHRLPRRLPLSAGRRSLHARYRQRENGRNRRPHQGDRLYRLCGRPRWHAVGDQ